MSEQRTLPEVPRLIRNYIDKLTPEQRDRIVEAANFKIGGGYTKAMPARTVKVQRRVRAIMGENLRPIKTVMGEVEKHFDAQESNGCLIDHATAGTSQEGYYTVGREFDNFYRKHSALAIAAIKNYIAKIDEKELKEVYGIGVSVTQEQVVEEVLNAN